MCEDKNDCDCKHRHYHHGRHHHGHGFSSIVKRTKETVEIPAELLEVAEIKEGDFLKIRVHRVTKPSEWKKHHKHHKD
jgi:hypothetical protein